ncbi:DUF4190 domain-containing protein [Blastococcus sp. VKM Ac-2987]|uniref:DUF4190 domain-containing protein n=1 Tax=Blastococcus sp. VKM Ac-2987 TaxID=3004141 RepID=UPI0022ABA681|nr:DUF4190 domain-containing protein [Blastococcus sp. VKM Ac-2987]MCZ2857882.1 DUF4190 domain-containing protein [Blastococcus sp. VKM Ac-2987]
MTHGDDGLYRGDPPPAAPGAGAVPPGAGYAPPGYAQPYGPPPGYGAPPGYGIPPGYGTPPGHPAQWGRPTSGLAIAALVMAFVFPPVGLGLCISARRQIRRTGEEGDGMALAGVIVGGIGTGIYVLVLLVWIIAFAALTSTGFGP